MYDLNSLVLFFTTLHRLETTSVHVVKTSFLRTVSYLLSLPLIVQVQQAHVCVCVRERDRECVCVCLSERESVCVCVYVYMCVRECV